MKLFHSETYSSSQNKQAHMDLDLRVTVSGFFQRNSYQACYFTAPHDAFNQPQ